MTNVIDERDVTKAMARAISDTVGGGCGGPALWMREAEAALAAAIAHGYGLSRTDYLSRISAEREEHDNRVASIRADAQAQIADLTSEIKRLHERLEDNREFRLNEADRNKMVKLLDEQVVTLIRERDAARETVDGLRAAAKENKKNSDEFYARLTVRLVASEAEVQRMREMTVGDEVNGYITAKKLFDGIDERDEKLSSLRERLAASESARERLRGNLVAIAHTFTEDSHGNMKTYPASYYQDIARAALAESPR